MRLTGSVPIINCSDIEHSLSFYQQALQFVVLNKRTGDAGLEWVYLQSGDTLLMLEASDVSSSADTNTFNRLYFYTDDVEAMRHLLQAKGFEVSPLSNTAYMQEFNIVDPDGNCLTIGQRLSEIDSN